MREYHKYTPEEIQFLRDISPGRYRAEILEMFNRNFGASLDMIRLNGILERHKIHSEKKRKYTQEELQFIRDNLTGRSYAELAEMFNRRFGHQETKKILSKLANRHGFYNGLSHSLCPPGTERINKGYVIVKTGKSKNEWKSKHRLIWEAANGPVPEGHVVLFADGNRRNFALGNLILVSRKERAVMNNRGLIFPDKDLTKAGSAVAKLILVITERERETGKRRIRRKRNEQDGTTGGHHV
jgi:hypothetical protein